MSLGFAPIGALPLGGQVVDPSSQSVTSYQITESEALFTLTPAVGAASVAVSLLNEQEVLFGVSFSTITSASLGQIDESESLFASGLSAGTFSLPVGQLSEFETLFTATGYDSANVPGKKVYATLYISRHISF
jgi:hypothetical protein